MTTLEFFKEKADSIDPRIFHEIDGYGNIPAVLRIMELYTESKQKLNIHGIGGPVSDVRSEGEQLGNEGSAKSVRVECPVCGVQYGHAFNCSLNL